MIKHAYTNGIGALKHGRSLLRLGPSGFASAELDASAGVVPHSWLVRQHRAGRAGETEGAEGGFIVDMKSSART